MVRYLWRKLPFPKPIFTFLTSRNFHGLTKKVQKYHKISGERFPKLPYFYLVDKTENAYLLGQYIDTFWLNNTCSATFIEEKLRNLSRYQIHKNFIYVPFTHLAT